MPTLGVLGDDGEDDKAGLIGAKEADRGRSARET